MEWVLQDINDTYMGGLEIVATRGSISGKRFAGPSVRACKLRQTILELGYARKCVAVGRTARNVTLFLIQRMECSQQML